MKRLPSAALVLLCVFAICSSPVLGHPDDPKILDYEPPYVGPGWKSDVGGPRGEEFFSANIELKSWISIDDFGTGATNGNDCWGYVSPSGREYAIMGLSNATAFVEVTNPGNAQIVQIFPGPQSLWRDIKVHGAYAYSVNQDGNSNAPGAGIQVFDMTNIDGAVNRVMQMPNVTAGGTVATHNVAIDTTSGFLYCCGGINGLGLRIYDLANPAAPQYVTSWTDRYVHDAQVVTYTEGPYAGRQIAFCCAGFNNGSVQTALDILDVTNKQNIFLVSRYFYSNRAYSHQGWLTPDRQYFYLDDELDEQNLAAINTTTTRIINVSDIQNPVEVGTYTNGNTSIDHNLYTKNGFNFSANYRSGLRIFNASNPVAPFEAGFFDTYPSDDNTEFNGAWSNFPYFPSGTVIVSDMNRGLFVLDPSKALGTFKFSFPDGVPTLSNPDGTTSFRVIVEQAGAGIPQPGTGTLHVDTGSGYQPIAMTELSPNEYLAELPAAACGATISFYVSAESTDADVFSYPLGAPTTAYSAISTFDIPANLIDNFETNMGWTTQILGATAGQWQRGVPFVDPNWNYSPTEDADGSGQCWLTENDNNPLYAQPFNTDVDNGAVRLISPTLDLSGDLTSVQYQYYLRLTDTGGSDRMLVEVNTANGVGAWTPVAIHSGDTAGAWATHQITPEAFAAAGVVLTAQSKLRFTVNDANPQTIVEAGLDDFRIVGYDCGAACAGPSGDLNGDAFVDGRDVAAFVAASLGSPSEAELCAGDYSGDAALGDADVADFVSALLEP